MTARHRMLLSARYALVATLLMTSESAPPRCSADDAEVALPKHELVFAQHSDATRKDYDIWRICADGTQHASLVVLPGHQYLLTVSPDGKELIYESREDGNGELWRRPFNGGDPVNLTNNPANDSGPSWSPDGTQLAFFSTRDSERPDLYVMDLESSEIRRVTDNDYHDSGASWHPDGDRIIFTRYFPGDAEKSHDGAGEIIELTLSTGEEKQLTTLGGYNGGIDYSPDGKQIACHHTSDDGVELWVMNADGSDAHAITDTYVDEYSPAWSPDGNWIAFTAGTQSDSRGTFDLFIIRPDGTNRRLVTNAPNTQMEPRWRPGEHCCR